MRGSRSWAASRPSTCASASPAARPSPSPRSSREGLPHDRGAGRSHLGRLGPARSPGRGARLRGALPLRPLLGDPPARRRRARRVGDARGSRRAHRAHSPRHARLAGDLPPPERPRADGRHRRPHLGRPRRGGNGLRLVRARARGARIPVPRRARRGSRSSPSRSRSSSARGPTSASITTVRRTRCTDSWRCRGLSSSRIRRSSSEGRSSRGSPRSRLATRAR